MSSADVKKAARIVFKEFKKNETGRQRESGPYVSGPRNFTRFPPDVANEAFHLLRLRNLMMRSLDYSDMYQLTSLGKAIDVDDIFEKTVDRAFVSQLSEIIDTELTRSCLDKSYEDAITSAFRILEERTRRRINAGPELFALSLIDTAFHPETGKLVFGETPNERAAVHQLFRSVYSMLRNPPSHRYLKEFAGVEIVEIIMFVDFLLKLLGKAQDRMSG